MLTRDYIVERLRAPREVGPRGSNEDAQEQDKLADLDRNPFVRGDKPLKPAAVLVPLVDRPEGITVMLTKRTDHLANHGGQVSFPGGRCDPEDVDHIATALRETEEEVGLSRRHIEIVGHLNDYIVGTGFLVSPVVGLVEPPFEIKPHDHEVAEVFEAPLDFVLDPKNMERHSRDINGAKRYHYAVTWRGYYIWGATAGMLRNLSQILWRG